MKEIAEALESTDAEVRRRATSALVRVDKGEEAVGLVMKALGDADWRVRKEAARVAAELAEDWALLPELVDALCQGENVGLRNAVLEVFERLGPRAASPLLVALPRVPDGARKFLVAALGYAGAAGVDRLAEFADDPDPNTAQAALESLAKIGGDRAGEALREHLTSPQPVQRLAALEGLERMEAELPLDQIRPLLEDRLVRRLALRALGFSTDPEVVEVLFSALDESPSAATTSEIAVALDRILARRGRVARELSAHAPSLEPGARRALREIAASGRPGSRRAAACVLLMARDLEVLGVAAELAAGDDLPPAALDALRAWGVGAVAPLLAARADMEKRPAAVALELAAELAAAGPLEGAAVASLRCALRETIESGEGALAVLAASAIRSWVEVEDAPRLVALVRRLGDDAFRVAGTLERLAETAPEAVEAAVSGVPLEGAIGVALLPALAAIGGPRASDRLHAALNAADPRTRKAAVLALRRLEGERAAELAGFALADEDLDVQVAAVNVLAQLNQGAPAPVGLDALRLALRATAPPVAAAAARALAAARDEESLHALRELVAGGRPGVAVAAMEALRAMDDPELDDLLVDALGQPDAELVKEALRAIAVRAEGARRTARIALALEHASWDVRQVAVLLLGELGGEEARRALADRAEREEDRLVAGTIEEILGRLGEETG